MTTDQQEASATSIHGNTHHVTGKESRGPQVHDSNVLVEVHTAQGVYGKD